VFVSEKKVVSWPVGAALVGAVVALAAWSMVSKSAVVEVLLRAFLDERPHPLQGQPVLPGVTR
jgi:hypothetical protein